MGMLEIGMTSLFIGLVGLALGISAFVLDQVLMGIFLIAIGALAITSGIRLIIMGCLEKKAPEGDKTPTP